MTAPLIFMDPYPRNEMMVYPPETAEALATMGRVVTHFGSRAPDSLVEDMLPDMEILIGQTAMLRERLERAKKLRAIVNVKANWEPNIDYAYAQVRGIHVLSAAPAMAPAVAEYCIGQAIALGRGLVRADRLFRDGTEAYGISGNGDVTSLLDAPVGLIGFGNLGRALLPLLRPFTRDIAVHDPWLSDRYLEKQDVKPMVLDALLSRSRYLFVLAGVTTENEGFLERKLLERLPENACVILASRAEIIDMEALLAMAGSGRLRAAVDVFRQEPVAPDDPIRLTPHVHFSAHLAGGISASYARIRDMMLDDIGQILAGHPPMRLQRAEPHQAAMSRSR